MTDQSNSVLPLIRYVSYSHHLPLFALRDEGFIEDGRISIPTNDSLNGDDLSPLKKVECVGKELGKLQLSENTIFIASAVFVFSPSGERVQVWSNETNG